MSNDPKPAVRRAEVRSATKNPEGTTAPLSALRTVLLYSIADPFALVLDEIMVTGFRLDEILAPLLGKTPQMVPVAVRHEMFEGHYSRALGALETGQAGDVPGYDPTVVHADLNDWTAVLMQAILQCYPLGPLEESAMHGQLTGLLRDLGVGHPTNPRGARYLPNDVRHRLSQSNDH